MIALLLSLMLAGATLESTYETLECKGDCVTWAAIDYPYWVYEPKPDITVLELSKIMELLFRINDTSYHNYDYGALIKEYGVERHFRKEK